MNKHRVRKTVIIVLAAVLIVGAVVGISIEPASYYGTLGGQIAEAKTLAETAPLGNGIGEYAEYTVREFEGEIARAEYIYEQRSLSYGQTKDYCDAFSERVAAFRSAANSEILTEEQTSALKREGKTYRKEIDAGTMRLLLSVSGNKIDRPAPINLNVLSDAALYEKIFEKFCAKVGVEGMTLTYLQNGDFPCYVSTLLMLQAEQKDLQVYAFDTEKETFSALYRAEKQEDGYLFSVKTGGTYFVLFEELNGEKTSGKDLDALLKEAAEEARKEAEEEQKLPPAPPEEAGKKYVYVEIRCDTIVDTSKLTNPAVAPYVPKDGVILKETRYELLEGETAFEVLKRVTRQEGIQMEFRSDPLYSGAYIEGIHHIYEYDAGGGSGWMYKVNGWFPNYGCGVYKLKDGDKMVWCYTCNIGKDVGDQYYDEHPDANPEYP